MKYFRSEPPVSVSVVAIWIEFEYGVVSHSAGGSHTCVVDYSNRVYCWGRADDGQLGHGNTEDLGDDESPFAAGVVPVFD